jgi:hypothetical protein
MSNTPRKVVLPLLGIAALVAVILVGIRNEPADNDNAVCIVETSEKGDDYVLASEIAAILEKQGITALCEGDVGMASISVRRSQVARALEVLEPTKKSLTTQGATVLEWRDAVTQEGTPVLR